MRYIKSYDKLQESVIYFSPKFRDQIELFSNADSEFGTPQNIAYELLNIELSDVKPDATFVDLVKDKDGYISFTQMKNALKYLKNFNANRSNYAQEKDFDNLSKEEADTIYDFGTSASPSIEIYTKSRNQIKIGKLIKSIFGDKYTDKQIEDFVNKFKSSISSPRYYFDIVSGSDIHKWYQQDKYQEVSGSLGSSCMRHATEGMLSIYTNNPEVCQLLIYKDRETDEILGRALLWNAINVKNNTPVRFMDRVYTIHDSDINKFKDEAKKMGYLHKWQNNYSSYEYVDINGSREYMSMEVQVKKKSDKASDYDYEKYPYMDTFRKYDYQNGKLINNSDPEEGHYILDGTGGEYTPYEDNDDTVWSDYYGENLDENEAIYSDPLNDYIKSEYAVEVSIGSRRYRGMWPEDHDSIVHDRFRDEYIHVEDAIWSEYGDSYVFSDDCIQIISYVNDDGTIDTSDYSDNASDYTSISSLDDRLWYKWLSDNNRYISDCSGIADSLIFKDVNDEWTLNNESYDDVYYNRENSIYLRKEDANLLGFDIGNDMKKIDRFDYYKQFDDIDLLDKFENLCNDKLNEYKNVTNNNQTSLVFDEEEHKDYINKSMMMVRLYTKKLEELEEYKSVA